MGYDPAMTATLPALLAGLLGLPFGAAARALARRHCGRAPLPGAALLAAVTGVLWALLALRLWPSHPAALPAYLALAFVCVTLGVIDVRTRLLPNRITYPALPLVAVLLLAASAAEHDLGAMVRALEASGLAGLAFLALVLISPGGLGLGDVKFALVLGLALGWLGWSAVAAGFMGAFLLGGVAALVAVVVLRLGRKAQLPFGPWLAAGALLAVLAGAPVATG
jgi:leader peptidase (prepilin peptidase) / N-methyltransferase